MSCPKEHCWHCLDTAAWSHAESVQDDGSVRVQSRIMSWREVCCFCGDTRVKPVTTREQHGPFLVFVEEPVKA